MENPGFDPGASRLQSAHSSDWANPPLVHFEIEPVASMLLPKSKKKVTDVGFEPTPPKRLVPKTSALDHSANQSFPHGSDYFF